LDSRRDPNQLDRRHFARAASSGLALFAIPGWFAACARPRPAVGLPAPGPDENRPRLLLHVSNDEARRWRLGQVFGIFLMRGAPEELAPLATCELRCATTTDLEAWGVDLTEAHAILDVRGQAPAIALRGNFPNEDYDSSAFEPDDRRYAERVHGNHRWIAAQLAQALGPGSPAFERGLARERAAGLGFDANASPSPERVSSAPCHSLAAAQANPSTREAWHKALATFAVDRWLDEAPAGSSWATTYGCAETLEKPLHEEQLSIRCGMGHVPAMGRRFLHLFSVEELHGG
jgi:hypothetical protein